jgi:hypothetical protein
MTAAPTWTGEQRRRFVAVLLASPMLPYAGRVRSDDAAPPPVVGTPGRVIERMLALARLRSSDTLIDLGSGDGRIVLEAAQRFGARAIGIEMRADLVEASRAKAERLGLAARASFRAEDIFATDLAAASVLTLYLSAEFNEKLIPRILGSMRPGARVVSHDFALGTWQPEAVERFDVPEKNYGRGGESVVMLWIVPANAAGRWQGTLGEGSMQRPVEFSIAQQFQFIEGALKTAHGQHRFTRASLRADEITLGIEHAAAPYAKGTVTARIEGGDMAGVFRFDGTSAVGAPFRARRVDTRPDLFD